ncbi:hypothetical protein EYF80_058475 [Liparis tanakae]|uniref:Uncharacterized protein n=1 Tax=Liparis tanakae TaxID=230148 RepID=A0A4Z2ERG9_9TELE|nr:hypothetical protein EYF80_058475 [Liparis tanakae]
MDECFLLDRDGEETIEEVLRGRTTSSCVSACSGDHERPRARRPGPGGGVGSGEPAGALATFPSSGDASTENASSHMKRPDGSREQRREGDGKDGAAPKKKEGEEGKVLGERLGGAARG